MMKTALLFSLIVAISACKKDVNSPAISSFDPAKGASGNSVIIRGHGFGVDKAQLVVEFNGLTAEIDSVIGDTVIYVTVPPAATTGRITVTRKNKTVSGATDFVILPGTWVRRADIPWYAGVATGVAFAINGKGYFTTGSNEGPSTDKLFEYDPATNQWTEKSPCPDQLQGAFRMIIGDKAYIGTGETSLPQSSKMWEYDPVADLWTQKADFPSAIAFAFGIGVGNRGFAGLSNTYGWWEYDPVGDTWTQKSNPPYVSSYLCGFTIGDKIYMGCGWESSEWWQYDTTNDTWTRKKDFPVFPIAGGDCFVINNNAYVVGGGLECWLYRPESDSWEQQAFYGYRAFGSAFAIGNKGYHMGGNAGPVAYFQKDLWEFTPPQ